MDGEGDVEDLGDGDCDGLADVEGLGEDDLDASGDGGGWDALMMG